MVKTPFERVSKLRRERIALGLKRKEVYVHPADWWEVKALVVLKLFLRRHPGLSRAPRRDWGLQNALTGQPCLACPTPGRCTDIDRCVTPKAGETWHILRAGAAVCRTVTIAEITQRTVLFKPRWYGMDGERLPLGQGLQFVEKVSGPNVADNRPP